MALKGLSMKVRRQLAHAACVAAWSDTSVVEEETEIVLAICAELGLGEADITQVKSWLEHGPDEFDPFDLEREHRDLFLDTVKRVIDSDGRVDPMESETFQLLSELLS